MTTLPLTDCCAMLGIDSKTLRHWLTLANLELIPHPTDARLKCLTMEHIEQLARLHGRPLPSPAPGGPTQTLSLGQAPPSPQSETAPIPDTAPLSPSFPQEADLIQKLSCLETRVATLSDQLAQLALTLLQERERTVECRLTALETVMQEQVAMPISPPPLADREARGSGKVPVDAPKPTRQLHPAEQRARSRMPALIEYSAQGTYVIISSRGAANCTWCRIPPSGLSGWRRSLPSASWESRGALSPIETPTMGAPRAPGRPVATSTSIPTGMDWE